MENSNNGWLWIIYVLPCHNQNKQILFLLDFILIAGMSDRNCDFNQIYNYFAVQLMIENETKRLPYLKLFFPSFFLRMWFHL